MSRSKIQKNAYLSAPSGTDKTTISVLPFQLEKTLLVSLTDYEPENQSDNNNLIGGMPSQNPSPKPNSDTSSCKRFKSKTLDVMPTDSYLEISAPQDLQEKSRGIWIMGVFMTPHVE
jgi:hypothetical protein